ncbi:polysaccharide deacetylase family protein [Undibacter mobilis]|uniref:Chitooligosaccharide deacetylase n=1 Tax=Undibacter mobilis TaxID=2292256 RepID=A0A371B352_9BRAD|nr:polysaccharide deacetylase family protein [Undibacter mobilis]RDV01998.1 polysaccharide deacetylase [Undibacter mobilis]
MHHDRFDYSPIIDRPNLRLPGNARVALWVVPNIEHFLFDRPSTSLVPFTAPFVPDVLNYGWRDYGVRVGIWRLMEALERHGIRGTVALNSDVCDRYPRIIEEGLKLKWDWMGHGTNNSTLLNSQDKAEEQGIVKGVLHKISQATGRRPKGWLGPALTESFNTLDILAEEGVEFVADWCNDDLPYQMRTTAGKMYSIPYSLEINDICAFLDLKKSADEFYRMIMDQFEVLYEEGKKSPRVMSICLHPFIIGHPFRIKYLNRALAEIAANDGVWLATGTEIIEWFKKESEAGGGRG